MKLKLKYQVLHIKMLYDTSIYLFLKDFVIKRTKIMKKKRRIHF